MRCINIWEKPRCHARQQISHPHFNNMQPQILAKKLLSNFSLSNQLVMWIIDF